jgi:hypothetical protein
MCSTTLPFGQPLANLGGGHFAGTAPMDIQGEVDPWHLTTDLWPSTWAPDLQIMEVPGSMVSMDFDGFDIVDERDHTGDALSLGIRGAPNPPYYCCTTRNSSNRFPYPSTEVHRRTSYEVQQTFPTSVIFNLDKRFASSRFTLQHEPKTMYISTC